MEPRRDGPACPLSGQRAGSRSGVEPGHMSLWPHSGTGLSGNGPTSYSVDSDLEKSGEAWIPQGEGILAPPPGTLGQ